MPGFCNLELARRLELAHAWRGVEYARAQAVLHPDWPVVVQAIAGGFAIYVGPGSPVNKATNLGMQKPVSAADWERVEAFYQQRGTPLRIALCPVADPSLLELLRHHAWHLEGFLNVLACALPEDVNPLLCSSKVEVTRANRAEAELWIRTTAQGFEETETPPQQSLDILAPNFYAANAVPFLALVDGQPAGGGSMLLHEGVAEFGGDSTRPAFRGRGVQTALLQARLAVAHELGCDLAMLLTEPGSDSQRNAERAGFRVMYTKTMLVRSQGS
jgi:GNAT superfamily N-acetyltransferase